MTRTIATTVALSTRAASAGRLPYILDRTQPSPSTSQRRIFNAFNAPLTRWREQGDLEGLELG